MVKKEKDWTKYFIAFAIVAALVFVVLPIVIGFLLVAINPNAQISKARDTKRTTDLARLKTVIFAYYQEKKKFPPDLHTLVPDYLTVLPQDPKTSQIYEYTSQGEGYNQRFEVCAVLEKDNSRYCETNLVVD